MIHSKTIWTSVTEISQIKDFPAVIRLFVPDWQSKLNELTSYLSSDEVTRLTKMMDSVQDRFILGRAILKRWISCRVGVSPDAIEFLVSDKGKPYLKNKGEHVEFNVSHSQDWVVIALADQPVGVDIEYGAPNLRVMDLANRFFHPADAALVAASTLQDQQATFYKVWTLKEAYLKARGLGIAEHLKKVNVTIDPNAVIIKEDDHLQHHWTARMFEMPSPYQAAVVIKDDHPTFSYFHVETG